MWKLGSKESWVLKNWCFWTVVLEKTVESPLDCKGIKLVHPKEIQPWIFLDIPESVLNIRVLEGKMLKLKFQYFGHLMQRTDLLENTLLLGKTQSRRRWVWPRMRWLYGITDSMTWIWASSGSWWWTGKSGALHSVGFQRVGHNWETQLNW